MNLHRFTILFAVCMLMVVMAGACVTTSNGADVYRSIHTFAGSAVAVLSLILAIWMTASKQASWLVRLGWLIFAGTVALGGLGVRELLQWIPATAGSLHACVAQLLIAAGAAVAAGTSPAWERGPEPVADHGWPSLRSLAIATPVLVLIQVMLGAAFRHKAIGVMPHILGAMLIALFALMVCLFVTQQFPQHRVLKSAANTLMAVTFTQVGLGIAVFTVLSLTNQTTPAVMVFSVAHVTVGALTLAASVVLGIQIRRNVHPAVEEEEDSTAVSSEH